ncbi:Unknown protein, partial [Striga hermonthica]
MTEDYQAEFECLMNKVTSISGPVLISVFIAGLKADIQRELLISMPKTLVEAFALARVYESRYAEATPKYRVANRWGGITNTTLDSGGTRNTQAGTPTITGKVAGITTQIRSDSVQVVKGSKGSIPVKNISRAEMKERRLKGLCYNCDDKWSPSHKCANLFLIYVGSDEDLEEIPEPLEEEELTIQGDASSLNALAGSDRPRSLRVWGRINEKRVHVLIDSGSTHNFIRPEVAERLRLPVEPIAPFKVYVGSGDSLVCRNRSLELALEMQGTSFEVPLYVLPIQGPEIVLGMPWLRELRRVVHDYKQLTMEFEWN